MTNLKTLWEEQVWGSVQRRPHALHQVSIMTGARVLGMGLGAVGSVWAARCLGPHNLGLSGMVQSIVAQAVLALGVIYSTVLIREYKNAETDMAREELIRVSNAFRLAGALVFCLIGGGLMAFHAIPADYHFAGWFFIPLLLIAALQPVWVFQAVEKQHFQSAIAVLQPALTAGLYLLLFRPGISAGADLAVISVVSIVLTAVYWRAIYRLTPMTGAFFDFKSFEKAWELIRQSRWLFISSAAVYVYTTLEQPLLGWLYSVEELGKYRTAVTVTNVMTNFFSISSILLYPRFIEWRKQGEETLWRRQLKIALYFSVAGGAMACLGFIFIPLFYPLVFGEAFAPAAWPCAILVLSKIVSMLNGIFVWGLLTDPHFDKFISFTMIGTALFSLAANLLLIPRFGMYGASLINLSSEVLIFIICIRMSARRIQLIREKSKGHTP
jgi:O-antigen/teichoic acid export membrane protein